MDLEYIDIPVKVFNRYAKCALCGGEYRPTDVVCMSIPPQYPHRCDKCGHTINLDECYPKIVFVEEEQSRGMVRESTEKGRMKRMREILFRGKRTDNDEWVYGGYSRYDCEYTIDTDTFEKITFEKIERYMIIEYNNDCLWVDVIPETIGQYINKTDKNGKMIFEGDIVSFKRVNALGYTTSRVGDVRYYDKLPIFYIMATTGDAWDWVECEDIEVIGNIHDNPELLKGDKDNEG